MGQKINPTGLRLGIIKGWESSWYGGKNFSEKIVEDHKIRNYIELRIPRGGISKVVIERTMKLLEITIHTARPGIIIGKKGEDIEKLRVEVSKRLGVPVHINIEEIRKPEIDSQLIADSISQQLEKRIMFRRAMKRAMQNAMRLGAVGIKIMSSGRLNGIEIARTEWYREGRVPLHTLRADIDYGTSEASTTYGIIGVKVWVYKGDRSPTGEAPVIDVPPDEKKPRGPRRDDGKPAGRGRPGAKPGAAPAGRRAAPAAAGKAGE